TMRESASSPMLSRTPRRPSGRALCASTTSRSRAKHARCDSRGDTLHPVLDSVRRRWHPGAMSYTVLEVHFRRLSQLEHVEAIASWDEAAMMPAGGGLARGAALATLKGLIHEEASAPRVGEWIAAAESRSAELGPWQLANLREIRRGYVR